MSANALVRGPRTSALFDVLEPSSGVSQFLPAQPSKRHACTAGLAVRQCLPAPAACPCVDLPLFRPAQRILPTLGRHRQGNPNAGQCKIGRRQHRKLRQLQSSMRVSASEIVKRTLDLLHKEQCEGMGSRTRALLSSDFVGAHGPEDLSSSYKQLGTGAGRQAWFPVTLQVVSEGRLPQEAPRTLRSLDSTSRSSKPPCLRMARPPMR